MWRLSVTACGTSVVTYLQYQPTIPILQARACFLTSDHNWRPRLLSQTEDLLLDFPRELLAKFPHALLQRLRRELLCVEQRACATATTAEVNILLHHNSSVYDSTQARLQEKNHRLGKQRLKKPCKVHARDVGFKPHGFVDEQGERCRPRARLRRPGRYAAELVENVAVPQDVSGLTV